LALLLSGSWNSTTTWLSGSLPTLSDQVTINTGHTVTIFNGESASAGKLNDNAALSLQSTAKLNMGNYNGGNPLQIVDYSYHIRGGLRGINLDALGNPSLSGGKLFSMKLGYEDDGNYYDGNIRSQTWLSSIDNFSRSFTYRYDGASRIKAGVYSGGKPNENYALNNVTYDDNGNIKNLIRTGLKTNNTFGIVDNLAYTYQVNSNKIQAVADNSGENSSFTDVTGSTDYTYYADGSLKSDANKGISLFEYNYLKLPKKVTFLDGKTISYQYSASGKKLKETTSTNDTTNYVGNVIYKNSLIYQVSHDEGRSINNVLEYDIKDHLGSLRVSFKDSLGIAKVTQESHTGVFGDILPSLLYTNTPKTDNFDYTGHERLKTFNLGYIDAGARWMDPVVPRFITIDPLAEISRRFSPYTYANDNPIRFTDPDGMRTQAIEQSNLEWSFSTLTHCDGCEFLGGGDKDKKKKEEKKVDTGSKSSNSTVIPIVATAASLGAQSGGSLTALTFEEVMGGFLTGVSGLAEYISPLGLIFLVQGDKPEVTPIPIPIAITKRETDDYILLYRNTGINEVSSYIRKGFNFGFSPGSLGAKEFWYTTDGLNAWLSNETFAKDYLITISVPRSIIGKLMQTQFLDGHLAAVVYPNNMNAFNKAKVTMTITKLKP
jgi:RHS repeat-associated protein